MPKAARAFVFEGMEILPDALTPFVERQLSLSLSQNWEAEVEQICGQFNTKEGKVNWDNQTLLRVIKKLWDDSFSNVLGISEHSYVFELLDVRTRLDSGESFTYSDAARALETMARLSKSIGAGQISEKFENMEMQVRRIRMDGMRSNAERRRDSNSSAHNSFIPSGMKPWREIVKPHQDVATGNFIQAEFAADLHKVHEGTASSEYMNSHEFYSRTFLTEGIKNLLKGAVKRLSGKGGDPIIELHTNFGGGKTHSMLALYHMFGTTSVHDLPGLDQLLAGVDFDKNVNRVVLVGTARGPSDIKKTDEGIEIKTTWGEMAYQLGKSEGYEMIRKQDEEGTAPGSSILSELFMKYSPCLILIDEWVAYLRNIYGNDNLYSGTFDANISFVQSLTEAVINIDGTLLVASLPASQIEVGGQGGHEALDRLKNTFSRVHSSWLPASQEESYEIVRRRLFEEIKGELVPDKDNTINQYMRMYRDNSDDFPQGTNTSTYKRQLQISYPIHPELFNQLYTIWNSIDKFQRTRGILRLMAMVVHELWVNNNTSIMIMPGNIPLSNQVISPELTKYLGFGWSAIIASDVDGSLSLPQVIDKGTPNLAQISATKRVACAIFMGTAPLPDDQNHGLDRKAINRAVAQPGEKLIKFSDALSKLAQRATHLHSNNGKYRYLTSPSLNKLATDIAVQLDENLILEFIDKNLSDYMYNEIKNDASFDSVHIAPKSSEDISDELSGCRIIVLSVQHPHAYNNGNSPAILESRDVINHRGQAPRVYKNVLIFLAADKPSLMNLYDASRNQLAWEQIIKESTQRDLPPSELKMAEHNANDAKFTFQARLKETWKWIIYPHQSSAHEDIEFESGSITVGQSKIFDSIQKKLTTAEVLYTDIGPNRFNMVLEKFLWHNKSHIKTSDLIEYCSKFVYMPRLFSREVLQHVILTSISHTSPGPFAYAEQFDETTNKYIGLFVKDGMNTRVAIDSYSVVVKADIAKTAFEEETQPDTTQQEPVDDGEEDISHNQLPKSFRGTVTLSNDRPNRDMQNIVENIVEQLNRIEGIDIDLILEIHATTPQGINKDFKRIILENASTLGFSDSDVS